MDYVCNVSYKNSAPGERDCPPDNQALKVYTNLQTGTRLRIVFSINEKAVIEYL